MTDPCNTAKLKARQKANFRDLVETAKILGPMLLTAIAILLIPVALIFLAIYFGPWHVLLVMVTVLICLSLAWFFKPTLQLYSCRLRTKVKSDHGR